MEFSTVFTEDPEAWHGSNGPWDHPLKEGGCTLWESPCVCRVESFSELLLKVFVLLVNMFS